jgi:hypothetical protein
LKGARRRGLGAVGGLDRVGVNIRASARARARARARVRLTLNPNRNPNLGSAAKPCRPDGK